MRFLLFLEGESKSERCESGGVGCFRPIVQWYIASSVDVERLLPHPLACALANAMHHKWNYFRSSLDFINIESEDEDEDS